MVVAAATAASAPSAAATATGDAGVGAVDPPVDKDKEIDVDTWEEGDSLASLLTAQVRLICVFFVDSAWYGNLCGAKRNLHHQPKDHEDRTDLHLLH